MARNGDPDLDALIDSAVAALPRGRRGRTQLAPTFLREIVPEDVPEILSSPAKDNLANRPMQRLRTTHHAAARCLAEGRSLVETSAITGYTPARLGQLQKDPTFKELLAYYKEQVEAKWLNVHERLANLGVALTEELQHRLEENPDAFSIEELRKWTETALDRGGYGPSKTANVNVRSQNASLHLIELVKSEAESRTKVKQLEGF